MEDKSASEEEIASIIYDSDIYENIREITEKAEFDTNYLIHVITNDINIHYGYFLNDFSNPSPKRTKYLKDHIESELSFYLIEARQKNKK